MKNRFRLRYTFWLDIHKPDEAALAATVQTMKKDRAFASAVRDGLRLIADLRAGRTDVLLELFPLIGQQVAQPTRLDASLQAQIARLEALMLAQGHTPIDRVGQGSGRALPAPTITTGAGQGTTKSSAQNFVDSMKGFAAGFFD